MSWEEEIFLVIVDYMVLQSVWRLLCVKAKLFVWAVCVRMNENEGVAGESAWQSPVDMKKVLVCPSSILTQARGRGKGRQTKLFRNTVYFTSK